MDAWATLLAGSSLPSGDAWEHLGAQGGVSKTVFVSEFTIELTDMYTIDLCENRYTAELSSTAFDAQIDCNNIFGFICPGIGEKINE